MHKESFFDKLYALQVEVLRVINGAGTEFYLTGGTAASRGYLNHRFSEDLDLFVNDDDRFSAWADRVVQSLIRHSAWDVAVLRKEERFLRMHSRFN